MIQKNPKLSVIMSEYNTPEDHLRSSIKSILEQTFKDFEVVLIDDCGSNNLSAIVEDFNDKRIRVIKNSKNRGLVYSLNKSIKAARSDILIRMDTDDIALPGRFQLQYDFINKHPEYAVVGSLANEFDAKGTTSILGMPGEKTKNDIASGDSLIHPTVIMRKDFIVNAGYYPNYKRAEDLALWFELLMRGGRLYVMDKVLLDYRVGISDYSKRTLTNRGGEIKARLHYYPLLRVNITCYKKILRSVISGFLPQYFVMKFRHFSSKNMSMRKRMNSVILEWIKRSRRGVTDFVYGTFIYHLSMTDSYKDLSKNSRKVFLTLVPDHGNLGDLALGYVQKQFMKDNLADYELVELPISKTYTELKKIKKKISEEDIIVITGGGDLGTLYISVERQRRLIIKEFPKNLIISFPQSTYFSDDRYGRRQLRISTKIYSHHPNLVVMARDKKSYSFIEQEFPKNKTMLTPDIVLWNSDINLGLNRENRKVVLSLRRDKESRIPPQEVALLESHLLSNGYDVTYRDTHINTRRVSIPKERDVELNSIWAAFSQSSVVITDRLHGLIFSVITKTPCIILDNNNGKVRNLYESWLNRSKIVVLAENLDPNDIMETIKLLAGKSDDSKHSHNFKKSFGEIVKILNNAKANTK